MPHFEATRWWPSALVAVGAAVGVFVLVSAVSGGSRAGAAAQAPKTFTPLATYSLAAPHVLSEVLVYSVQGVAGGPNATPPPDTKPFSPAVFSRPLAEYRSYALEQLRSMEGELPQLQAALAADDREAAKAAWRIAFSDYLRMGAVYLDGETALDAELASLNRKIDGTPGGLQGGTASPDFSGLHRIEYGLWGASPPSSLLGVATSLATDVRSLAKVLPVAQIEPLEYATRGHEILEDAVRGFLSASDVPWSQEGVLATHAGVEATEEVVSTERPLLGGLEHVIPAVDTEMKAVRAAFREIAAAHGGSLPSNGQLTQLQAELLDGTLGGALEALSQIPGVLETEAPPVTPQMPTSDFRTDRIDP